MPRLQKSRRPCGRGRPVIHELCARHNRRPAADDRQLTRSRFPSGRPAGAAPRGSQAAPSPYGCRRALASESLPRTRGADLLSRRGAPHCRAGNAPELRGLRASPVGSGVPAGSGVKSAPLAAQRGTLAAALKMPALIMKRHQRVGTRAVARLGSTSHRPIAATTRSRGAALGPSGRRRQVARARRARAPRIVVLERAIL